MKKKSTTNAKPIYMPAYIQEQCDLACIYASDGAYFTSARVLATLAEEVKAHAEKVMIP